MGAITYKRPIILAMLFNAIAYTVLFFHTKPYDSHALLIGSGMVLFICLTYLFVIHKNLGDEYIFLIVSMLASMGILITYRLDAKLGLKQMIWFVIGTVLFLVSCLFFSKVKVWSKLVYYYLGASAFLYVLTLAFGKNINGAKNWITIGGHSFQPSELVKILFIMVLACYFSDLDRLFPWNYRTDRIKPEAANRIGLLIITFMNIGFLFLQREWGTAALFFLLYLILLYTFGKGRLFFWVNLLSGIPVALSGYYLLYHIRVRVDTWLNPWADASGKGYQILQSLFAIGTGGFFGTGLGMGHPDLVPAVNTDFIFSAVCEEMGIFGGIGIILLFFLLAYRGCKIALSTESRFKKILALGISVMFGLQSFIIIGGVIKLIPLTGITLPFVSYGGSSLVSSFISLGILQAISRDGSDAGEVKVDEGE